MGAGGGGRLASKEGRGGKALNNNLILIYLREGGNLKKKKKKKKKKPGDAGKGRISPPRVEEYNRPCCGMQFQRLVFCLGPRPSRREGGCARQEVTRSAGRG